MPVCLQCPPGFSPQAGSIVHMSVSFSYKYLSLFTDTGYLWTGSSQLQVSCSSVQLAVRSNLKGWGLWMIDR